MPTIRKIFVVIDPTTDKQAALTSAGKIASGDSKIELHVYEAVYSSNANVDADALKRVEMARHRAWVEALILPIRANGNAVTVELEWTDKWRDAIAPAATRANADLIIKMASSHNSAERRLLKTSDWEVLRNTHCPVYLIKRDGIESGAVVLAALDIKRDSELHNKLNASVLDFSKALVAGIPGSKLHAVNAYASSENFVYQEDLAQIAGIDRTHAHAIEGAPEKVIPQVAEEIDASIVVIGTASRQGLKAVIIGNTAEKILDALHTNILTVNAAS